LYRVKGHEGKDAIDDRPCLVVDDAPHDVLRVHVCREVAWRDSGVMICSGVRQKGEGEIKRVRE